jgi:integrase
VRAVRKRERGERDYLFLNGSTYWMKFQRPGCRIERSLKTSNKLEALASDDYRRELAAHIQWKLERQAARNPSWYKGEAWQVELQPGLHENGRTFATDRLIHTLGPDGAIVATRPNGGLEMQFDREYKFPTGKRLNIHSLTLALFPEADPRRELVRKDADPDQSIWDAYLKHGGRNKTGLIGKAAHDATVTWERFRKFIGNKPLKNCTRADGRAFVAHLLETPNPVNGKKPKSASVARGLRPLAAAVNLAIGDGLLELNPFVSVVPDRGDSIEREAFTDADCERIKSRLGELSESDRLLIRLLATTGMRLDEPFQATREYQQDGIRYVHVGTKTEASDRKLPLPAGILEYLPNKVTKPLFDEPSKKTGARLRLWLKRLGFDKTKTLHSFRHRAGARLTKLKCPSNVRRLILGHAKDISEEYGKSDPPFELLKEWVDKIGF